MNKVFTFISSALFVTGMFMTQQAVSQTPHKMSYQAVIRDNQNHLVTNHAVGIQITVLQGSPTGTVVYTEAQIPSTNADGLISIEIGGGTGFSSIDWSAGAFFLKTETDPVGGTNYTISGTSQLLSVPYALYSKSAGSYYETDPVFTASPSSEITASNIANWNNAESWGNHADAGYLLWSRELTINGVTQNLETNRSWNVGTVTSVNLSMPAIFSVSGSPITGNGTLSAALVSQSANLLFASPGGSAGPPAFRSLVAADIPNLDWSKITTGKPTTLEGYGITDGVNTTGDQTIGGTKTFSNIVIANNGINANNKAISSVADPNGAQDAATKAYVDKLLSIIQTIQVGVNDMDGNRYKVIIIGNHVLMAENLKTTKYNDGTSIPLVTDNSAWSNLTTPGYCWYSNNESNKETYGALYNWYTVNTGKLCPTGWHVPTDAEWTTMANYLIACGFNYDGITTGNKIAKALASTSGWTSSSTIGVVGNTDFPSKRNATGYTALPCGNRSNVGVFSGIGSEGNWWSATEFDASNAWYRNLVYSYNDVYRGSYLKKLGFSVRCIKD
jgi:uncharacterized protein (TIGR02145 family)